MNSETTKRDWNKVVIPDLWEISQLPELKGYSLGGRTAGALILETWHLAHELKKAIIELQGGDK